jgi:hypothetical protein
MKLKELEPEVRDAFQVTIQSTFDECSTQGHLMTMEFGEGAVLFVDTERGPDKGVLVLSHEELITLIFESLG